LNNQHKRCRPSRLNDRKNAHNSNTSRPVNINTFAPSYFIAFRHSPTVERYPVQLRTSLNVDWLVHFCSLTALCVLNFEAKHSTRQKFVRSTKSTVIRDRGAALQPTAPEFVKTSHDDNNLIIIIILFLEDDSSTMVTDPNTGVADTQLRGSSWNSRLKPFLTGTFKRRNRKVAKSI